MKKYFYICKAKKTDEVFLMYGNFKDICNRPRHMFKKMAEDMTKLKGECYA